MTAAAFAIGTGLVKRAGEAAVELAKLGAQAERTEHVFTNISGGAADAARNLEAMRQATRGTMSELDMMLNASKLMQMGLADNSDELGRLTEMATRLGTAMGMTATKSMDDFAMMLANKSTPRLDQFGLSSGKVRERWNELKATMGDDEAFKLAVLEQGEEALERLGEAVDDSATEVEQATAAWQDFKAEVGKKLAPALGATAKAATDVMRANERATASIKDQEEWLKSAGKSYEDYVDGMLDAMIANDKLASSAREAVREGLLNPKDSKEIADNLGLMSKAYYEMQAGIAPLPGYLRDMAAMELQYGEAAEQSAEKQIGALEALENKRKSAEAWGARYQAQADALGAVTQNTLDAAAAEEEAQAVRERAAASMEEYRRGLAEAAQEAANLAINLKDATEKQIAQELIGMLDPEELGAVAYATAVEDIGLAFGLMDEKSLALAEHLPQLAEAINEGVAPADEAAALLRQLIDAAGAGVGTFDALAGAITAAGNAMRNMPQVGPIRQGGLQQFQHGGTVPGPVGSPQLAVVHGGEQIIPSSSAQRGGAGNIQSVHVHLDGQMMFMNDEYQLSYLADRIARNVKMRGGHNSAFRSL